jgi:hypothetical protein
VQVDTVATYEWSGLEWQQQVYAGKLEYINVLKQYSIIQD